MAGVRPPHPVPRARQAAGGAGPRRHLRLHAEERGQAPAPVLPAALSGRVRTVALPLPPVAGLPEGAESTADVPPDKVELLKTAFDGLAAPFADFLASACAGGRSAAEENAAAAGFATRPDWIVVDFAHYWLCPIAEQHQVACATFQIVTATMLAYFGSRQANADHPRVTVDDFMPMPRWFPSSSSSSSLAFRRHEAAWIAATRQRNASGVADSERFWRTAQRCRLLLVRSCSEVEPRRVFSLLAELHRMPVLPTGLLLPADDDDDDAADEAAAAPRSGALRWLDEQPPGSVLYVALGSEAPVTPENVRELALGNVRRVMVAAEGKTMLARNARKLRDEVVGVDDDAGGRQEQYVDELVRCLQSRCFTE